jgi:hypothetical protein
VGDPTAADGGWGAAKKRVAVAADNQETTNISSYAKPDFVKQLIRKYRGTLVCRFGTVCWLDWAGLAPWLSAACATSCCV